MFPLIFSSFYPMLPPMIERRYQPPEGFHAEVLRQMGSYPADFQSFPVVAEVIATAEYLSKRLSLYNHTTVIKPGVKERKGLLIRETESEFLSGDWSGLERLKFTKNDEMSEVGEDLDRSYSISYWYARESGVDSVNETSISVTTSPSTPRRSSVFVRSTEYCGVFAGRMDDLRERLNAGYREKGNFTDSISQEWRSSGKGAFFMKGDMMQSSPVSVDGMRWLAIIPRGDALFHMGPPVLQLAD